MPARGARGVAGVGRGAMPTEAEVLQRLTALSLEQRRAALRFEDAALVGRLRTALQVLFEKQSMMQQLCVNMGCEGGDDAFEVSILLKQAFEFTFGTGRLVSDPSVIHQLAAPVLIMKGAFLQDPQHLYDQMRGILPDFLSPKAPRPRLPKARWKELWATEPTSMAALEQQLAKLTEQALWAMAAEPEPMPTVAEAEADDGAVEMEPWMAEHDEEVSKARAKPAKKKKKNRKPKAQPTSELTEDATGEPVEDLEDDGQEADEPEDLEEEDSVPTKDNSIFVEGSYLTLPFPVPDCRDEEERSMPTSSGAATSSGALGAYDGDMPWCHRPPLTPPSSPLGTSRTWRPAQLVNYLWGQTSQLSQLADGLELPQQCCSSPSAPVSTHTPVTPMSCASSQGGTPWSRGQWRPFPQASGSGGTPRVVVRNTFIDMEVDDSGNAGHRSSRSLSPSFGSPVSRTPVPFQPSHPLPDKPNVVYLNSNEQWQWHWH